MKKKVVYLVHIDALSSAQASDFKDVTNTEIQKLYKKGEAVLRFESLEQLADTWNLCSDDVFDPDYSYIRTIEEEV